MLNSLEAYKQLATGLQDFEPAEQKAALRKLCREDLFWLLWWGLGRQDVWHPWLLERCRDIQNNPDGHLDLWSRDHYKSTIQTFAKTIQDILSSHGDDPDPKWKGREATIGIFSCTRPIAMQFLRQIKQELGNNQILKELFPDILWNNPEGEAPKWSESDGLIVKRKSNQKEATIEAWGVIDGQPISKHFLIMVYDDLVTKDNSDTPYMIEKTLSAWEMSSNLSTEGGIKRYVGTIYKFNDPYKSIIDRGAAIPRKYPATAEGTWPGTPVFRTPEWLETRYKEQGVYTFSAQILMNPVADTSQGFRREWLKYHHDKAGQQMNIYILIDPANEKKKTSDYTAIMVVGLASDQNYYILDMIRDRLSLTERADRVFELHRKYKSLNPTQQIPVGYERYGIQADIAHIQDRQSRENYRFPIIDLGGNMPKNDRIRRLVPLFEQGRLFLPESCFKTNYEGRLQNLVDVFVNEEYISFPVPVHDDMLDVLARILDTDLNAIFPMIQAPRESWRNQGRKATINPWAM